MNEQC